MSDCFLFFRLWPGFTDPFPVDRFNAIAADADLARALDSYAREEIGRPEVRHRIKQVAKTRRRNSLAAIRKQSASRMMVGSPAVGVRKRLTKRDWYWPRIRQAKHRDPLVCRLGAYLGWWREAWSDSSPFGSRVWFCRVSSPELAEALVSLLNGRTGVDYDRNEVEYHLRPRFGFVEDADTTLQIVAQRCINAMRRGEAPDVRGSKAALAMGQKAMAIADEMLEAAAPPTPVQDILAPPTPDQATSNGGSTPTGKTNEGEGGGGAETPLGERDRLVLTVLKQGKAFSSDHRITTADIAKKATGKIADANQFKEVVAKLGKLRYVGTKTGRTGGCWLTAAGKLRAEQL